MVEKCVHDVKSTPIQWTKPPNQWVKLNSDGSCLPNGNMGAGGVIRNKDGEMLLAYSTPLGVGSNNQAEIEAALFGIAWCTQMGFYKVILEVDSEFICKWINHQPIHLGILIMLYPGCLLTQLSCMVLNVETRIERPTL